MPKQLTPKQVHEFGGWHCNMRGPIEWEPKRFILPRRCYVTNKWSGFFPVMYVGIRMPHPNRPKHLPQPDNLETWLVLPEVFIMKRLTDETIAF